jgi:hypothetical protein
MYVRLGLALVAVSCAAAIASEKPDFSGTWRAEGSDPTSDITIHQDENKVSISGPANVKDRTDISCNTMGKECEATIDGRDAKVSYWFNGPTLVETVIEGRDKDKVTKTRRTLSDDGRKLYVEVIPIMPAGKAATKLVFVREQQIAGGSPTAGERQ